LECTRAYETMLISLKTSPPKRPGGESRRTGATTLSRPWVMHSRRRTVRVGYKEEHQWDETPLIESSRPPPPATKQPFALPETWSHDVDDLTAK